MAKKKIFQDAEGGNPYARLGLAYMYHHGKNIDPDPEQAIKWYVRSSELGCSRAKWELAKIFRDGTIVKKDHEMFILYLRSAADSGVPEAKVELGFTYLQGAHIERDEVLAFKWMHSAAGQGNPMAQFMTGYMYGRGIGVFQDISEQELWYAKTGLKGNGELFYWIGRNFEYGLFNVGIDLFEAGRWYKMGADMGHEKCTICWQSVLSTLGGRRHDSLEERETKLMESDVEKEKFEREEALAAADHFLETGDEESAFINYTIAAELGNPVAMFALAMMYHAGVYVKRDDKIALELMKKASVAGSEDAQFAVGTMYEEGRGLKKELDEAIKYYTMAAANGYLAAYYRLSLYMDHPEIHVRNSVVAVR
ncbi:MAG: sel1 repeat family protein [Candidatus Methanoplasma sp.]|jgi:TPR repeat protein|nr:sel1 repeat family protein [Candidatus Methanoplasma sp.]